MGLKMSELAIYRDEQHAVIRAMTIDAITSCKPAQWQQQYSSGYVEDLTAKHSDLERLTMTERLTQDAMTRAKIHRAVSKGSFLAIVAKYSADENERAVAINELAAMLESKATAKVRAIIIWMWACIAIRKGVTEQIANTGEQSRITFYRRRREIFEQLNNWERQAVSDASIVLGGVCLDKG